MDNLNIELFSRQIGAIGTETMTKLMGLNILVVGASASGQECVKCLSLSGVKSLHIYDNTRYTKQSTQDLYFKEKVKTLGENNVLFVNKLNPNCISKNVNNLTMEYLIQNEISCLIITKIVDSAHRTKIFNLERDCTKNNIKFILGIVVGLESYIFSNFGNHIIKDKDGEPYECVYVEDFKKVDETIELYIEKMNKNLISDKASIIANNKKHTINVIKSNLTSVTIKYDDNVLEFLTKNNNIRFLEEKEIITKTYKSINDLDDISYQYISLESSFPDDTSNLGFNIIKNTITNKFKEGPYYSCIQQEQLLESTDNLFILSSITGGIIAHEAIKCTGKYMPLDQEIYINFKGLQGKDLYKSMTNKHRSLLDKELIRNLKRQKIFMVGAGALGCEISKNLGMMDICTSVNSKLNITDMDRIEVSNLNRQFLFSSDTIGDLKSETIKSKLNKYIPDMKIKSMKLEVGSSTEEVFNSVFWKGKDIIINALDNVAARKYVDAKCTEHDKPLFESGTMGCKCNTQTIIPYNTATYSEIIDQEDKTIPMCTIKSFPNKIEHCVEWGLETFHNTITQPIIDLNQMITNPNSLFKDLENTQNTYLVNQRLSILTEYCKLYDSPVFLNCIHLAEFIYTNYFKNPILDILNTFPEDMTDDTGKKYWSGKKLKPKPIGFDDVDRSFTKNLYNTLKPYFNLEDWNDEIYTNYLENYIEKIYTCKTVKIDEKKDQYILEDNTDTVGNLIEKFREQCTFTDKTLKSFNITNIEYDKDNSLLLSIMTSYSNYRATIYNIPIAEAIDIKLLSGRIIPALSTTTTVISGFVVLEVIKYLYNKQYHKLKPADININLGINQYTMFNSQKPKQFFNNMFSPIYGMNVKTSPDRYNTWDKLKFSCKKESCTNILDMIDVMNINYNIDIHSLSFGKNIIYNKGGVRNQTIYELFSKYNIPMCECITLNINSFDNNGIPILTPPLLLSI